MGLSKVKQHTLVSGGVRGTLPWMAPELLSGKSNMVTEKASDATLGTYVEVFGSPRRMISILVFSLLFHVLSFSIL